MFIRKLSLGNSQVLFRIIFMLFLESFMLTENYYNFFCIIKIPIHGIDSKGLGFVFFYFLFFLSLLFSFLKHLP